ncbi:MAG: hypothetical protein LW875_07955 [Proteobacteria bacterium]|jgi:hypothetical protein|nr:hypothetical protein [Pseudomonadota bacterium]
MKKLLLLLVLSTCAWHLSGCTSKDAQDDTEIAVEDSAAIDGELEKIDSGDVAADSTSEGFLDEQLPADALGETTTPPAEVTAEAPTDPAADSGLEPVPEISAEPSTEVAAVDPGQASSLEVAPPLDAPVEATPIEEAPVMDTPVAATTEAKPASAPLRKIDTTPRAGVNGEMLNAVYIARPGDNYRKIASLIYGDRTKWKTLRDNNPSISSVKPGNKIYYNSPVRPQDDTKVLTYYEDQGMVPEIYMAQEGDELKKVAKNLLGYDRAWQEIWSTNPVESKGTLTAGTELRYWKAAPAAPPAMPTEVAGNAAPNMDLAQAPPAMDLPPPPPQPMDMAQAPPAMDLPPPPPAEALNPPPPPPVAKKIPKESPAADEDMMTALGAGAVIAGGLALILILRKRRQKKEMENAFNDTQVGT